MSLFGFVIRTVKRSRGNSLKQLRDGWEERASDKRTCQESRRENVDVQPAVLGAMLTDEQEPLERDDASEGMPRTNTVDILPSAKTFKRICGLL